MSNPIDLVITRLDGGGFAFEVVSPLEVNPSDGKHDLPQQFRVGEYVNISDYEWVEDMSDDNINYQHGDYPAPLLHSTSVAARVASSQVQVREIRVENMPTIYTHYRRYLLNIVARLEGGVWQAFNPAPIVRPEITLMVNNPRILPYAVNTLSDGVDAFEQINETLSQIAESLAPVDMALEVALMVEEYQILGSWLNTNAMDLPLIYKLCGTPNGKIDALKLARLINPSEQTDPPSAFGQSDTVTPRKQSPLMDTFERIYDEIEAGKNLPFNLDFLDMTALDEDSDNGENE